MHVALIGGTGGHGRNHLHVWRKHPEVTTLTVVARDPARLEALAQEFGVAVTIDPDRAATADLVDICTPTDTHAELAGRVLDAGVPVLVEKPPCRTSAQAEALATRAAGTPLDCVLNLCHAPVWRRARELVAQGVIGRPQLSLWPVLTDQRPLMMGTDFRADAARGGGALLDGAFHLAYLVPFVLGSPIRAVRAWAGQLAVRPPAGEDTGLALWEHDYGVAQVTYSWAVPNPPRTPAATLLGDEATLLVPRSAREPLELICARQSTAIDLGTYAALPRNDLGNCLHDWLSAVRAGGGGTTWAPAVVAQQVIEATERAAARGTREVLG